MINSKGTSRLSPWFVPLVPPGSPWFPLVPNKWCPLMMRVRQGNIRGLELATRLFRMASDMLSGSNVSPLVEVH